MAAEPRLALQEPAPEASPIGELSGGSALADQAVRRLKVVVPAANLIGVALVSVFLDFVVPLPGANPSPASQHWMWLAIAIYVALAWLVCETRARRVFAGVRRWVDEDREPDDDERTRTVRYPMTEAVEQLPVWGLGAVAFGAFEATYSAAGGALVALSIVLGALISSALTYLLAERAMRPLTARALQCNMPAKPLLPGVFARIYLAWEVGTAVAVWGIVALAVAYLAGAHISPHRLAVTAIFLSAVPLTVGLGILVIAIRSVSEPVKSVQRAFARVEAGETDVEVPVDDGGEIGLLQAGFNRMIAAVRERDRIRDLFGRHVGEEVARSALARGLELGGEVREAAVLFVDVIGSTSLAATHDPREVVATLNRFFGVVVEVVTLHGGWVNKFEGDAALCVFGAPTDHPDAAAAALAAGRELRRRLQRELDGVDAAIGLSAGTVVAGNIGARRRYEYTVIGDPVNEAARLTELAKTRPSRLLASDAIVRRAGAPEAGRWDVGDPIQLRGRSTPTRVAAPQANAKASASTT
jgi:adenylate cyclase